MDEQLKQSLLMAVLAFNVIIILFQLFLNGVILGEFSWVKMVIGILLALAGAGAAFFGVKMTHK